MGVPGGRTEKRADLIRNTSWSLFGFGCQKDKSSSSTLAWKIPWTEEPGGLQSLGLQRVGHDWATSLSLFTFVHWRRKWQPTPVFLPGESQGRWSLVGCVYGVAQSRTRLKWLSSSSSSSDGVGVSFICLKKKQWCAFWKGLDCLQNMSFIDLFSEIPCVPLIAVISGGRCIVSTV